MSSKDIITVGMIRRANERVMAKGAGADERRPARSEFLDREISNPVRVNAESINSTWAKIQKTSACG